MKKKLLTISLSVALTCSFLLGCGTGSVSTADRNVDTDTTTVQDTGADTNTAADSNTAVDSNNATDSGADMTDDGKTTLTYCGHAGIKIVGKDGTVVYVDPNYYTGDYSAPADYVFVTHKHDDHQPYHTVTYTENGQLLTNEDMLHDGIYEIKDFGNLTVEAVPAGGNQNHDVKYCVGYLITIDGLTIYHAGDTSKLDTMSELADRHIDYALYPIDGKYNMDAVEATEVAGIVGAKYNIPIHEFDNHQLDPAAPRKSDNFNPDGKLVLEYGETIVIGE